MACPCMRRSLKVEPHGPDGSVDWEANHVEADRSSGRQLSNIGNISGREWDRDLVFGHTRHGSRFLMNYRTVWNAIRVDNALSSFDIFTELHVSKSPQIVDVKHLQCVRGRRQWSDERVVYAVGEVGNVNGLKVDFFAGA